MILPWGEGGACDTGRIPGGHGEAFGAGTSKTTPFRMDVDGEEVKKCALRPPGLGRERKPLRGATQFQTQNASLWPFLCGRENRTCLQARCWCFAYSCAVIAVDGGILPRNQEKVKAIEAKSDFNTVDDKLGALSAQCAHWAPPPQGEARETLGTDCRVASLLAMTVGAAVPSGPWLSGGWGHPPLLGSPCGRAGAAQPRLRGLPQGFTSPPTKNPAYSSSPSPGHRPPGWGRRRCGGGCPR